MPVYGKRRIRAALLEEYEMIVNIKLVGSIMRERGLAGLPRLRWRKPDLLGVFTPEDRVERQFTADRPNQLWFTDITEHPARDGKVYCCAILDGFSEMVVGRTFFHHARHTAGQQRRQYGCARTHPSRQYYSARRSRNPVSSPPGHSG